jgi:hypothetical protein
MRSITLPNKKDNTYIDNLNKQEQEGKQINNKLYIQILY